MKNFRGKIELAANLSIIVVAALSCVVLVKSYLAPATVPASDHQPAAAPAETRKMIQRGDPVNLPGVDWQKNERTLLLALSTTCRFCAQSAPFYQRVVKEHGDTKLIALVPQGTAEGHAYLRSLGVDISEVRAVQLGDLGLSGTPTLILADSSGTVADVWVGALPLNKQNEVLNRLRAERASN